MKSTNLNSTERLALQTKYFCDMDPGEFNEGYATMPICGKILENKLLVGIRLIATSSIPLSLIMTGGVS